MRLNHLQKSEIIPNKGKFKFLKSPLCVYIFLNAVISAFSGGIPI